MTTIFIAEKPIAGRKIAELLSDKKFVEKKHKKVPYFEFTMPKIGDVVLIPLKGHIEDVDFPKEHSNWYSTNIPNLVKNVEVLYYSKEKQIIELLKKMGKGANSIVVATDADREGESIGREAVKHIQSVNAKVDVKRMYFSAITKDELQKSVDSLKELDLNIADAADARREIDLILGSALTRFLSLATRKTGKNFLSVGRVQSPTLAKIVHRELEIENFISSPYWEIEIMVKKQEKQSVEFKATHTKGRFLSQEDAKKAFEKLKDEAIIDDVTKKEKTLPKPIPFSTTDFLRAATSIGVNAIKAMNVAEKLYMEGYISYPRTDNQKYIGVEILTILEDLNKGEFKTAVEKIKNQKKIVPSAGRETKDHPPIHPVTYVKKEKLDKDEWKLYKLVVDRFFATLSEDAKVEVTEIKIDNNTEKFVSKGNIITKKGWLEFYSYQVSKDVLLPILEKGEMLDVTDKNLLSKETKPPKRYSQGTLLKLMETLNLGTKSTRPSIIQKLYLRDYMSGVKQIIPSKLAKAVVKSLDAHADAVTDPKLTAELEDDMNKIEDGKNNITDVVRKSREELLKILDVLEANKPTLSKEIIESSIELFGDCPACKGKLMKRKSKKGNSFIGCNTFPNCKTTYSLPFKGTYSYIEKKCDICKAPMIDLKYRGNEGTYCLNTSCKNNWMHKKPDEKKKEEKL
jgi:DNA topoisomerase I